MAIIPVFTPKACHTLLRVNILTADVSYWKQFVISTQQRRNTDSRGRKSVEYAAFLQVHLSDDVAYPTEWNPDGDGKWKNIVITRQIG